MTPYQDGLDAAYRRGRYEGAKDIPPCPWADGTPEHDEWWRAFGEGTEDLIAWSLA